MHTIDFGTQVCSDVDECATDNGGCNPLVDCVNTLVSTVFTDMYCISIFNLISGLIETLMFV